MNTGNIVLGQHCLEHGGSGLGGELEDVVVLDPGEIDADLTLSSSYTVVVGAGRGTDGLVDPLEVMLRDHLLQLQNSAGNIINLTGAPDHITDHGVETLLNIIKHRVTRLLR